MSQQPLMTIIIPTACTTVRAVTLRLAITSIQAAGSGLAKIIVAANGPHIDNSLATELRGRDDIRYLSFEAGSAPKALAAAVPLVDTEYYGFLDDDDELLPGSLTHRLSVFMSNPNCDVLLSNGYIHKKGTDTLYLQHLDAVPHKPLDTFFMENWLPSCGALFRASTVGAAYFANYHAFAEWSWLAFRLAMNKKQFCILNEPTFRIHADTPHSLSKSSEYGKAYISLYQKMLDLQPPLPIQKILKKRLSQAHHDVSAGHLNKGEIGNAMHHHLRSLGVFSGLRFLPYTRHIVSSAIKR